MADLIDRQEAIRLITGYNGVVDKSVAKRLLTQMPPAQPEPPWIPCSEGLPIKNGDYLVTLENGVVTILGYSTTYRTTYPKGFYYLKDGFSWRQIQNPVIAWMELPAIYKAESEEME